MMLMDNKNDNENFILLLLWEHLALFERSRSPRILVHPVYAYVEVDRKRSIHPEISLGGKVVANTL